MERLAQKSEPYGLSIENLSAAEPESGQLWAGVANVVAGGLGFVWSAGLWSSGLLPW